MNCSKYEWNMPGEALFIIVHHYSSSLFIIIHHYSSTSSFTRHHPRCEADAEVLETYATRLNKTKAALRQAEEQQQRLKHEASDALSVSSSLNHELARVKQELTTVRKVAAGGEVAQRATYDLNRERAQHRAERADNALMISR